MFFFAAAFLGAPPLFTLRVSTHPGGPPSSVLRWVELSGTYWKLMEK